jgi:hypothetical protein
MNQMNYRERQALDHWLTTPPEDDEPDEGIEVQPELDVPDVYDRLQQVEDELHAAQQNEKALDEHLRAALADAAATRDALTVARADLLTLARAQGGPLLLTVLAHINEMPAGFCYCDDCRNATSIRILARIWKEGQQ